MKILLVSTYERNGGAAVACYRLFEALQKAGADVRMIVQSGKGKNLSICNLSGNKAGELFSFSRFALERLVFLPHEKSKDIRFAFSPASTGYDITGHPWYKESDIIHLHWINQGFISLKVLEKIKISGKKVVWTLHDMWAFTGGCHYSGSCSAYQFKCSHCPYLKTASDNDLSTRVFQQKERIFKDFKNLQLITCSKWLRNVAISGKLVRNNSIKAIPNPIDTQLFIPKEKKALRKKLGLPENKKLILFGAMNIKDKRKGFEYFREALDLLIKREEKFQHEIAIILFGKSDINKDTLSFPVIDLGAIADVHSMVDIYNVADLFVIPSIEDNLPNTIMESLSCGIPVAAFNTGGIPEMINHKVNGYLAQYKSSGDLAKGIEWVLFASDYNYLALQSRKKVLETYDEKIVLQQYFNAYEEMVSDKI